MSNFIRGANVDLLLSRLDGKVKQTGTNKWLARCPAHDDRSPSLAIRYTNDDSILLYCFAGCDTNAVLAAIGLNFADLFPQKKAIDYCSGVSVKAKPVAFSKSELFELLLIESIILALAYEQVSNGTILTDNDKLRVKLAYDCVFRLNAEVSK